MESPQFLKMSTAAAMTLGLKDGLFYRNARSPCINLLLTYNSGCCASCAYCGLSMKRPGRYQKKSFIRVDWPIYPLQTIIERIRANRHRVKRVCLSMITNHRAIDDSLTIVRSLSHLDILISLLASPTLLSREDLIRFKDSGVERLGIAVDGGSEKIFDRLRGKGVKGPHRWDHYWKMVKTSVSIFGSGMVGVHLIVGLGETEKEMVKTIQYAHDLGSSTHLFSFFPEPDSMMANHPRPSIESYRRIQLARFLIDEGVTRFDSFRFSEQGEIVDFGIGRDQLIAIIDSGKPFMTSGCPGQDGEVACNRPYANSLPGEEIRNFPFRPEREDIELIKKELGLGSDAAGGHIASAITGITP